MRDTRIISEIAILVSLAVVLEVVFTGIATFFPVLAMPYGGRVSLSMLPLFIIVYRHGFKYGIMSGVIYGLLNLLLDGQLYFPWSLPLDYIFAFGAIALGYAGVLLFGRSFKGFVAVAIIGGLGRFLFHFISGFALFSVWMPEEFSNIYVYSLVYNAYYMVPSVILAIIVGKLLFNRLSDQELF